MDILLHPGVLALAGTIVGTLGLKILEKFLSRNIEKQDLRRDIHSELTEALKRIDKLEDEVTQWRQRYYAQEEQVALLRTMLIKNGHELPERLVIPPGQGE